MVQIEAYKDMIAPVVDAFKYLTQVSLWMSLLSPDYMIEIKNLMLVYIQKCIFCLSCREIFNFLYCLRLRDKQEILF